MTDKQYEPCAELVELRAAAADSIVVHKSMGNKLDISAMGEGLSVLLEAFDRRLFEIEQRYAKFRAAEELTKKCLAQMVEKMPARDRLGMWLTICAIAVEVPAVQELVDALDMRDVIDTLKAGPDGD